MSLIDLQQAEFEYEPFPMGLARNVFAPDVYERMVEEFPSAERLNARPEQGSRFTLSAQRADTAREYRRFLRRHKLWRELDSEVRSREFRIRVLELLRDAGIDLALLPYPAGIRRHIPPRRPRLRGTLEFSMKPANGGHIVPHTDMPQKVITLVFSIVRPGEWQPEWGGGTDMLRPTDPRKYFNFRNEYLTFDEVEVLHTFPFEPNQAVLFVKTFNSLHCVRPMTGPEGEQRRTLTVNLMARRR